ncbi:DUF6185 family protein [Streptomyces sp. NPDC059918]|uniref:DUF6185 family protein n=1 Tax=unclassified Streptomyces TaxID=2593676 RepID=UPI00364ED078
MIHLRRHMLLLLPMLTLYAAMAVSSTARAAPPSAATCTADRLKEAQITTTAEFVHRGSNVSKVTSVTEITVPAGWEQAPHLFLDTHAADYRSALRCLLGKGADAKETEISKDDSKFYDYEWRFQPVSVSRQKEGVVVSYEAIAWVQALTDFKVGLWEIFPNRDEWTIELKRPPSLEKAKWASIHVKLGGPVAASVEPPTADSEARGELLWKNARESPRIAFRPPAAQLWTAIVQTRGQDWEALGAASASSAFPYIATGALSLIAGRRLRRGLGRNPLPLEKRAFAGLRFWVLILVFLGFITFMGDDLYRFLSSKFGWGHDYAPTVSVFSTLFVGVVLCLFGTLSTHVRVAVCVFAGCLVTLYVFAELFESALLSTSEGRLSSPGARLVVIASVAPIFVWFLGVFACGQRLLLLDWRRRWQWVMICVAAVVSGLTGLWAFLAFGRSWERRTWLTDLAPTVHDWYKLATYGRWWQWFASDSFRVLGDIALQLAPLALVGVLRVCRAEQRETDSFTPNESERAFLVIFFAVMVVPNYATYFGFSGYVTTLVLGILAAAFMLAAGRSRSVLEKPAGRGGLVGQVVLRTDRSELLRTARRYRDLQSRLHHLKAGPSAEQSGSREAIEQEIDQLDRGFPEGVRAVDLPFAFGPMGSWWGNACRCALISSLIGLPATGVMYWLDMVSGPSWSLASENSTGFLAVMYEILYWQVIWASGGFFLGALWRDLLGRNGPAKALSVTAAFAVPVGVHDVIAQMVGLGLQNTVPAIAAFASVMTFSGLSMDVQTFRTERRYRSSTSSLLMYIYRMPVASGAFLLAQLVALVTILKYFQEGGSVWLFDVHDVTNKSTPEK